MAYDRNDRRGGRKGNRPGYKTGIKGNHLPASLPYIHMQTSIFLFYHAPYII